MEQAPLHNAKGTHVHYAKDTHSEMSVAERRDLVCRRENNVSAQLVLIDSPQQQSELGPPFEAFLVTGKQSYYMLKDCSLAEIQTILEPTNTEELDSFNVKRLFENVTLLHNSDFLLEEGICIAYI